jgi:hypothetical protein
VDSTDGDCDCLVADLDRFDFIRRLIVADRFLVSISESAISPPTPASDTACRENRTVAHISPGQCRHLAAQVHRFDVHWRLVITDPCAQPDTELAATAFSPAADLAASEKRAGMEGASNNVDRFSSELHWSRFARKLVVPDAECISVTKAAVPAPTPTPYVPGYKHRAAMLPADSDRRSRRPEVYRRDATRSLVISHIFVVAISELTKGTATPTADMPRRHESASMVVPRSYRRGRTTQFNGSCFARILIVPNGFRIAIAELSVVVFTPTPHVASRKKSTGELLSQRKRRRLNRKQT